MVLKKALAGSLIFVLIYNLLFFDTQPGIGTGILIILLNIYLFSLRSKNTPNLYLGPLCSFLSMFFGLLFSFRASELVIISNFLTSIFFALCALYFYKTEHIFDLKISGFILLPLTAIENSLKGLSQYFQRESSESEGQQTDKNYQAISKGAFIAFPIFTLLLILLIKADPVFGKLINNLLADIWQRILVSFLLFITLFILAFNKLVHLKEDIALQVQKGKSTELLVILSTIVILFALFIGVQFRYFFSSVSEVDLKSLGINSATYSEYIRKGFFELLVVASIAASVIIYALRFLHQLPDKKFVQFLSAFLTLETGLILLSAAKRDFLYADAHGLTRARIFGFIFLIWLASMLCLLLWRTFQKLKPSYLFYSGLILTIFAHLLVNLINVDGLIAEKYKPTVNGETDYFYIVNLSTDASVAWKEAMQSSENELVYLEGLEVLGTEDSRKLYWARNTLMNLSYQVNSLNNKYNQDKFKWQSLNYSEFKAYKMILEDKTFDKLPELIKRANALDAKIPDNIRRDTRLDRDTKPPLI